MDALRHTLRLHWPPKWHPILAIDLDDTGPSCFVFISLKSVYPL
jgi:hypothetical protein